MDSLILKTNNSLFIFSAKYISFIILFFSVITNALDRYNLAIILLYASFSLFYFAIRKDIDWSTNPLKIPMLFFMLMHLLFWLRCILASNYPIIFNYSFISYMLILDDVPEAVYSYLIMTYIYFLSFYFGYITLRKKVRIPKYELNQNYLAIIGITCILIASFYYLLINMRLPIPIVIQYLGSNIERFFYFFWCLFTIMYFRPQKKFHKSLAVIAFTLSTIMGFIILITIKMRFIILMQFFCMFIIYLSIEKLNKKKFAKVLIIILIVTSLFGFLTNIKFDRSLESENNQIQQFITNIDESIYRLSSTQVETYCVSWPQFGSFISTKKTLVFYEILGGLPFANLFFSSLKDEATLDMQINWIHAGERVMSSANLPLFTSLKYAFNIYFALLIAIIFGYLHGIVCKKIVNMPFDYSWIIGTSLFVKVAFAGVNRAFILGIFVDILFYLIVLRMVSVKKNIEAPKKSFY